MCCDPLARYFLDGVFAIIVKSRFLARVVAKYADWKAPGSFDNVVARTRYIDECLQSCLDGGIDQLVVLGAGNDTRAYRFDGLAAAVKVFEVDHPNTQRVKKEKVRRVLGETPLNVVYVPIEFGSQRLDEILLSSGYDPNLKTLFIWEGVSYYLATNAVDEVLSFVTTGSGEGSSVIFDYVFRSAIEGTCNLRGAKQSLQAVARRGEPYIFGMDEESVDEVLSDKGLRVTSHVDGRFSEERYFRPLGRKTRIACFYGYVHATVDRMGVRPAARPSRPRRLRAAVL